ncbi:hepatoma-derived growth factor-like [Teleopsis dalmanni]|uniref:hepatoma-derived growth factor-like n=1 Tax=Teleopsis dalmanni TaxID=139649 RepID=UPI0018CD6278|nr:hepatoma-derived growth factor-like [Teleopsis dalmanni]
MPKKKKYSRRFEMGDFVFAKVRFYPAWPARILKAEKNKFQVHFYGTGETGTIKLENIFKYKENKTKFSTEKTLKLPYFRRAIMEIEAGLEVGDSGPMNLLSAAIPDASDGSNVHHIDDILVGEDTLDNLLMKANEVMRARKLLVEVPNTQCGSEVSK